MVLDGIICIIIFLFKYDIIISEIFAKYSKLMLGKASADANVKRILRPKPKLCSYTTF